MQVVIVHLTLSASSSSSPSLSSSSSSSLSSSSTPPPPPPPSSSLLLLSLSSLSSSSAVVVRHVTGVDGDEHGVVQSGFHSPVGTVFDRGGQLPGHGGGVNLHGGGRVDGLVQGSRVHGNGGRVVGRVHGNRVVGRVHGGRVDEYVHGGRGDGRVQGGLVDDHGQQVVDDLVHGRSSVVDCQRLYFIIIRTSLIGGSSTVVRQHGSIGRFRFVDTEEETTTSA